MLTNNLAKDPSVVRWKLIEQDTRNLTQAAAIVTILNIYLSNLNPLYCDLCKAKLHNRLSKNHFSERIFTKISLKSHVYVKLE